MATQKMVIAAICAVMVSGCTMSGNGVAGRFVQDGLPKDETIYAVEVR